MITSRPPRERIERMVGRAWVIRNESETVLFADIGTLKSARMRTHLPLTSISSIVLNAILLRKASRDGEVVYLAGIRMPQARNE